MMLHPAFASQIPYRTSDLKRLKEVEGELGKLKRMYADLALENRALKDLIEKKL